MRKDSFNSPLLSLLLTQYQLIIYNIFLFILKIISLLSHKISVIIQTRNKTFLAYFLKKPPIRNHQYPISKIKKCTENTTTPRRESIQPSLVLLLDCQDACWFASAQFIVAKESWIVVQVERHEHARCTAYIVCKANDELSSVRMAWYI